MCNFIAAVLQGIHFSSDSLHKKCETLLAISNYYRKKEQITAWHACFSLILTCDVLVHFTHLTFACRSPFPRSQSQDGDQHSNYCM